jgi:hypothetical protein
MGHYGCHFFQFQLIVYHRSLQEGIHLIGQIVEQNRGSIGRLGLGRRG